MLRDISDRPRSGPGRIGRRQRQTDDQAMRQAVEQLDAATMAANGVARDR
jgi:hypothetical protein